MRCDACHRENATDARFCVGCGAELRSQSSAPAPAVGDVLSTRAAREGERKHLTVLIADIAGSTALIDHLDPEDAADRLSAIVAAMREAVTRFEGTVTKLQGDGVVALFGAPIPREDHAVRACCAGLAMVENVRLLEGAPPIRVGIHTGEVVVRAVSTDLSQQYEAMGRTVHIAARLEQEAPGFEVLISDATLQATAGLVEARSIGQRQLRGVSEKIPVHTLWKIRSEIASQQFRGGQKLSPFVGRDAEFGALMEALEAASSGASPVVCIVGEAGSGKSRLVFEFLERCRARGRSVLEARATGHGRASPLRPILDLIRTYFGIEEATSNEEAVQRVTETLQRHDLARDLPLLLDFLGLPLDRSVLPTDVAVRRLRLIEAIRRIARAFAAAQPAVFVLEDLHWLDPASEPFVEALAEAIAGTTTLMVVNFRTGYARDWLARCRRITLEPLPPQAVEEMVDSSLGTDQSLLPLRQRITDRAGGNPFFAEELMRSAIEREGLTGPVGHYRSSGATATAALPSTIESLLGSRIDRLLEPDKLLLQAASVVGREFSLSVVADIAEIAAEEPRVSVQRLAAAQLLYERLGIRRDEFAFRHPLVQEAAYGSLLTEQRRRYHRGAARALATQYRERLDEYSSLIAHHWEEGGDALQAASSYVKSALWIGARDPRQALETWRTVRRLLQGQPPAQAVDYMLMMACGQMVNYAWWQGGDAAAIEPVFQEAIALAHKLKDMRAATLITMAFGRVLVVTGSSDDYVAKVEEAQQFSRDSGNESVEAVLRAVHSHALVTAGHLPEALEANTLALGCVHRIIASDRQTLGFDPEPWLKTQRARILMLLGKYEEAAELADALLNGPSIDTVHRVNALGTKIEAARRNRLPTTEHVERLREALQGNETPYLRVLGNRFVAIGMLANGEAGEAADLLKGTIDYARAQRAGLELEPYLLTLLAEASMMTGFPEARAVAAEARDLARRRAMRTAELEAAALLEVGDPSPEDG
jgi:adenylate cyclase